MQCFLGDPESGMLNLETHCLALAIVKKTLYENRFKTAHKTVDHIPPSFKIGDQSVLQEYTTWQKGPEMATRI